MRKDIDPVILLLVICGLGVFGLLAIKLWILSSTW